MGEEVQKIKNDAPVKVDEGPKRFVEKGPHVVLDTCLLYTSPSPRDS